MQTNAVVCAIVRVYLVHRIQLPASVPGTPYPPVPGTLDSHVPCPMSHVPGTRYTGTHWYTRALNRALQCTRYTRELMNPCRYQVHPRTHDVPGTPVPVPGTLMMLMMYQVRPRTPTRALPCTRYAHGYPCTRYAHALVRTRRIPHVACQPPRASPHVPIYRIAPVLSCAKVFTVVSFSSKPSRAGRPGT